MAAEHAVQTCGGSTVGFEPVNRSRVGDQVCDAVRAAIIAGRYRPGDRLPSEREMAEQFGVNRSSIREALHRLEAWGLVEIRHGGGAIVQDLLAGSGLHVLPWLLAPDGEIDAAMLADVLSLRVGLLGFAGEQAAVRAEEADVTLLAEAVARIEASGTREEIQRADYAFFEALVAATHNRALMLVVSAITPVYEQNREAFVALYPDQMDTMLHRACVAAIQRRDADGATEAMRAYALAGLWVMQEAQSQAEPSAGTEAS